MIVKRERENPTEDLYLSRNVMGDVPNAIEN